MKLRYDTYLQEFVNPIRGGLYQTGIGFFVWFSVLHGLHMLKEQSPFIQELLKKCEDIWKVKYSQTNPGTAHPATWPLIHFL